MLLDTKLIKTMVFTVLALALASCGLNKVKLEQDKTVNIQEWNTKNGVRVLYVYAPELPMVDIKTVFDAGSVRDKKIPGIASLTSSLLSGGAKLKNKILTVDDISESLDSVGARLSSSSSKDMASISLRTLTDEKIINKAVNIMQAVINQPTFNNKEFKRVRKNRLIGFEGRKQSPGTIASEMFYKGLYKTHPYATPSIGTEKSIKKITRKNVVDFYKRYYVAKNAMVTIVGSVSKEKAKYLAEKLVGRLAKGKKASKLARVKPLKTPSVLHREFPSSQTHIIMGHPGVHRKDKDYFTLYVANHILGGSGFGSRIMKEIREKRGLAYSSYSYFSPMLRQGPFTIGMQTSNKNTDEALKVLKQTLNTYIANGPTEKELIHSKKNITGGFPLRIDSNSDISSYLAVIGFYNLPLSYLKDFNVRVDAITLEQIKETIKRRIHPETMVVVTVGAKEKSL